MINTISSITSSIASICALFALVFNIKTYNTEKRLSQAKRISIWEDSVNNNVSSYKIMNASDQPVYNVIAFEHFNNDRLNRTTDALSYIRQHDFAYEFIEILPPDSTIIELPYNGASAGNGHDVPAIFFTDASNIQWYRRANGHLQQEKYVNAAMRAGMLLKHV